MQILLQAGTMHSVNICLFEKKIHVSISSSERAFVAFYVSFCCLILYSTRKGEQVIRGVCMGIMLHPRSNSISTSPTACNFGLPASETRKWQPATSIQCSCGNLTAHCQPVRRLLDSHSLLSSVSSSFVSPPLIPLPWTPIELRG